MYNGEETKQLLVLQKRFADERDMIGWLCAVHRNKVHYDNNLKASKVIQQQLNHASSLISLAYIWAILEEHGFNENNKWINEVNRLELKAWKHVRHTGAHAPSSRADRYYDEFNEFMKLFEQGLSGLKQNYEYSDNSISLKDGMTYRFFYFANNIIKTAIGHCANNNKPSDV